MPRSGSGPPTNLRSSTSWRSPAGSPARDASARARVDRRRVDLQLQTSGETGGAQQAQRVGGEAALAHGPQQTALEIGKAAKRVERLAASKRRGDGADREVALAQVILNRRATQRSDVDLPTVVGGDGAPSRELGGELEGVPGPRPRDRLRDRRWITRYSEVEIDHVTPQRRVADCAADDPDPLVLAKRTAGKNHWRRRGESLSGGAHWRTSCSRPDRHGFEPPAITVTIGALTGAPAAPWRRSRK